MSATDRFECISLFLHYIELSFSFKIKEFTRPQDQTTILVIMFWNFITFWCRSDLKNLYLIQYNKPDIVVASRVAKRIKIYNLRKLGNIREISSLSGTIAVKKHAQVDIKDFQSCPVLPNFFILFQIFFVGLQKINNNNEDKLQQRR